MVLTEQYSKIPCIAGLTYGYVDGMTFFVKNGCSGKFIFSGNSIVCASTGKRTECKIWGNFYIFFFQLAEIFQICS